MAKQFFNACQLGLLQEIKIMLEDKDFKSKSFQNIDWILPYHDNPTPVNFRDVNGRTGLHLASSMGHLETVKFLVSEGANVDAETPDGFSPLMMACINGHFTICKYLLWQNCDISINVRGFTALDYAKIKGHEEIVALFDNTNHAHVTSTF